jgi:preprotein translocase subunit SecG
MLVTLLYVLFFISCLVLVGTILLQPGKADAGALFTSSISSTAFGPRGTQSVLSRITIAAAACFMLTALLLAMPLINGGVSVLNTTSGSPTTETTSDLPSTGVDANSNTTVVTPAEINTNAAVDDTNANTATNK